MTLVGFGGVTIGKARKGEGFTLFDNLSSQTDCTFSWVPITTTVQVEVLDSQLSCLALLKFSWLQFGSMILGTDELSVVGLLVTLINAIRNHCG